jgi:hypothetical protein
MFTPPFTVWIVDKDHVRVTTTSPGSLEGMYPYLVSQGFECSYEGEAILIKAFWRRVMAALAQYGE